MRSTGPIVAAGAISAFVAIVVQERPVLDAPKIAVATAIAAGGLALAEKLWPDGAVALSWMALVTVLLVRVRKDVPAPAEAVSAWLEKAGVKLT